MRLSQRTSHARLATRSAERYPPALLSRMRRRRGQDCTGVAADECFCPDRKSTRLNSSHGSISYAVFCLKKKNIARNEAAEVGVDEGSYAIRSQNLKVQVFPVADQLGTHRPELPLELGSLLYVVLSTRLG